jgi:ATP-dependent exoDNAse (exonuclease V) alpha subunit
MADIGSVGGHAAQVAAYATRKIKDTSVPYAALRSWWVERAATLGFDQASIESVCDSTARHRPARSDIDQDDLFRRLDAPDGLTQHRATFDRRDVIRQICDELSQGADIDDVLGLADEYLASRHVVPLNEEGSDRIRRADGRSAPIPTDGHRWTTPDMLRVEKNLIQMAGARRFAGAGLADSAELARAVVERPILSSEQQAMVQRICGSGDGVEVVPGIAGSGKTFALAAAHDAWKASGHTVVGVALSAQAARQLETGSGIPSATIARFQRDIERPGDPGLSSHHVLVIDEAAMVGTRALVALISRVHKAGAKAVLIGDACQLPEIDAGGAFAGLTRRSRSASLTSNRRQHEPWERQALADLRLGHAPEALAAYQAHDRIHHDPDPQQTCDDMVARWWATAGDGGDALMLAARHDTVRDLNTRARRRMGDAGRLHGDPVELGGREYSVGDRVLGLTNDYRIGILNGTRASVAAIDVDRGQLHLVMTDGGSLALPFAYAEGGGLAHGYAMTNHKAQGATCDHALVLVDETVSREAIYTGMSRGRQRNNLYLAVEVVRDEAAHAPEAHRRVFDVLMGRIEHTAAKRLALDSIGRR